MNRNIPAMDAYFDSLRQEGHHDSAGRFSVDWRRAGELLGGRLLASPDEVALKLVQAAVGAGATRLRLDSSFLAEFDRPELTEAELASLPGALLAGASPLRDLALALHHAVHSGCRQVFLRTPQGTVQVTPDRWTLDRERPGTPRVDLVGYRVDLAAVALRCPHPPLTLELPDVPRPAWAFPIAEVRHVGRQRYLALPLSKAAVLVELEPEDDYPEMIVGLSATNQLPAQLWLSVRGVVQKLERLFPVRGVLALASADHLTLDPSGLRVVEDAAFEELLEDLRRESRNLARELQHRYPGMAPDQRLEALKMGLR